MLHDVTKSLQCQCCVGAVPRFPCFRNPKVIDARQNTGNTTSPYETVCLNSCIKVFKQLHEKNANEHVAIPDTCSLHAYIHTVIPGVLPAQGGGCGTTQRSICTYVYTNTYSAYTYIRTYVRTCRVSMIRLPQIKYCID